MLQFFPLCRCQHKYSLKGVWNNKIAVNGGEFEAELCYKTLNKNKYTF